MGGGGFVKQNNSGYRYIISVWKAVHVVNGASLRRIIVATAGAYPGFSERGGGRDPPKKLTSQTSARLS